jgi:hypothetical protein
MGLTSITKAFDPVVPITRAALIALQGASNLVEGTTYAVTDAQDALGGTVTMFALSNTQLESDGYWNFTANLGAQGRFQLNSGAAGSVNQITVTTPSGPVTLLTVPVPFNTTRNQTALDVVTAINANTGTSGFRAWATTSTTAGDNFDQPYIYYESIVGQTGFSYTLSVNVTTLTVSGAIPATVGFNSEAIQCLSKYDLANDRIIHARDNKYNISITTSITRITGLGYNPVTTFRWNDVRFKDWMMTDSAVRNVAFKQPAALASAVRDFILDNSVLESFSTISAGMTRVWLRAGSFIRNINGVVSIGNLRPAGLTISDLDIATLSLTADSGTINSNNSTCGTSAARASLSLACSAGGVAFTNNTYRGTLLAQIASNAVTIGGGITVSNNIWVGGFPSRCLIIQNEVLGGITITGNTELGGLIVTNNVFQSSVTITNNNFGGFDQGIIGNTLTGQLSGGVPCFFLDNCTFFQQLYILYNTGALVFPQNCTAISSTFTVYHSHVDSEYIFPLLSDCNIQYSTLKTSDPSIWAINPLYPTLAVNLTLINSTVNDLQIEYCTVVTIVGSSVNDLFINNNPSLFQTLDLNKCKIEHTWINTAPDPITTIDLRDTELIRGEYTTTYVHDFAAAPLIAGSPITINQQFWGYVKEKASIASWNGWIESVPGVVFELGDNMAGTYLSGTVAAIGSISATFTQDTTLNPAGFVMTTGSVLEMRAIGGDITSGSAIIVVSGKYMYITP